jgi:hypothetical protein
MGLYEDFDLELRTGEKIAVRAPTLDDQEVVLAAMPNGGEMGVDPKDPRNREVTWRILYHCARWPDGGVPPTYEEFRKLVPLGEIARNRTRINAFFGLPPTPSATSAPLSE